MSALFPFTSLPLFYKMKFVIFIDDHMEREFLSYWCFPSFSILLPKYSLFILPPSSGWCETCADVCEYVHLCYLWSLAGSHWKNGEYVKGQAYMLHRHHFLIRGPFSLVMLYWILKYNTFIIMLAILQHPLYKESMNAFSLKGEITKRKPERVEYILSERQNLNFYL